MFRRVLILTLVLAMCATVVFAGGIMWSYEGKTGPDHWGELAPDWAVCGDGRYQSPIDLTGGLEADLGGIETKIKDTPLAFGLDGPTFAVEYEPGSWIKVNNTSYEVQAFHFHHTSEHAVDGKHFPMECHIVLKSKGNNHSDAVMGILIEAGAENDMMNQFWNVLPRSEKKSTQGMKVNVGDLFPEDRSHFMYEGSMTTPGCPEGVRWFVLETPVEASQAQIDLFIKDFTAGETNNRPLQESYGRVILKGK